MSYGYLGSMRAQPGKGIEVVDLLLTGVGAEPMPGCELYVVGTDQEDPDLLRISEVWTSKEAHDASLTIPAVRDAIATVMPMLTGEFTSYEVDVHGGFGLGQNKVG